VTAANIESIEDLAIVLATAKRQEDEAKARRIEAEEAIAALVETPANGSRTVAAGPGLKITVKRALGYKADVDAIRALGLPEELAPIRLTDPVPAGYAFDEKAYEDLVADHPTVAAKLADCVVATPRKVSVSIKIG
jgi:hypothetical protein